MRIISKFHDYYDSALAHGADPDAIYQRRSQLLLGRGLEGLDEGSLPWNLKHEYGRRVGAKKLLIFDLRDPGQPDPFRMPKPGMAHLTFSEGFVVAAGKATTVWLRDGQTLHDLPEGGFSDDWAGSPMADDAKRRAEKELTAKNQSVELASHEYHRWSRRNNKSKAENLYNEAKSRFLGQDFTALHLATGAPVLLLAEKDTFSYSNCDDILKVFKQEEAAGRGAPPVIMTNPRLANLNWAQALGPASMFQEISQFISGVVPGHQMPLVQISDQDMVRKKGFDPTYGFRKRPSP